MTAAASDELLAIAEQFGAAQSADQLCDRFCAVVDNVGDFHYALGRFRPHAPREPGVILVRYPESWQRHYRSRRYIEIDPTIEASTRHDAPFGWDELSLDARQRQLFEDARDLGVAGGLTVPIHMTDGTTFLASFAAHARDGARRLRPFLSLISAQFLERHSALSRAAELPVQLSDRERDCLSWTARGKSAWEIGMLLGISENTVNFHLKNACAKLACNGRMLGVVRAIMLGLISP